MSAIERKISIEFDKIQSEMAVKAIRKKQKWWAFMVAHDGKKSKGKKFKVICDKMLKHIIMRGI